MDRVLVVLGMWGMVNVTFGQSSDAELDSLLQRWRSDTLELDERLEVVGEFLLDEGIGLRRELFIKELERFVTERLPAAVLVVLEEDRSSLPDNRADGVKVVKQEHRTALLPWKHLGHLQQ